MFADVLLVINTVGLGLLLYKAYVPRREIEAPTDEEITLNSDTEGLA